MPFVTCCKSRAYKTVHGRCPVHSPSTSSPLPFLSFPFLLTVSSSPFALSTLPLAKHTKSPFHLCHMHQTTLFRPITDLFPLRNTRRARFICVICASTLISAHNRPFSFAKHTGQRFYLFRGYGYHFQYPWCDMGWTWYTWWCNVRPRYAALLWPLVMGTTGVTGNEKRERVAFKSASRLSVVSRGKPKEATL